MPITWVYVDDQEDSLRKMRPYTWKIVNALQTDAKRKGVLKGKDFGSFWNNLDDITHDPTKCFVAVHTATKQIIGYMVLDKAIGFNSDAAGTTATVNVFEVFPRWRTKGNGTEMLEWLIQKAQTRGYSSLRLQPANKSEGFWEKNGFIELDHGYLTLPIA
jgi:GNAT superfamily N-acetyltransferase